MDSKFNPDSGTWLTKDHMRRLLDIGDINTIDNWRRKFGFAAEHTERAGDHRGVWLYAPDWLSAYFAATSEPAAIKTGNAVSTDHVTRLKKAQADREELRYLRDLEVLLHIRDATRDVDMFGSAVRKGIERLPPACQEIMLAAIDDAENEWIRRHGDGIQRANAEANGTAVGLGSPDGGSQTAPPAKPPRVRRKVHHDAVKRAARGRKV